MPVFEVTMKPLSLSKAGAMAGGDEYRTTVVCADKNEAARLALYLFLVVGLGSVANHFATRGRRNGR